MNQLPWCRWCCRARIIVAAFSVGLPLAANPARAQEWIGQVDAAHQAMFMESVTAFPTQIRPEPPQNDAERLGLTGKVRVVLIWRPSSERGGAAAGGTGTEMRFDERGFIVALQGVSRFDGQDTRREITTRNEFAEIGGRTVLTRRETSENGGTAQREEYSYDDAGRLASMTLSRDDKVIWEVRWVLDDNGKVHEIHKSEPGRERVVDSFDKAGRIEEHVVQVKDDAPVNLMRWIGPAEFEIEWPNKQRTQYRRTVDKQGNVVNGTCPALSPESPCAEVNKAVDYDSSGNWTRIDWQFRPCGAENQAFESVMVSRRDIAYFK